ncbi:MAG: hypothetical protein OEY94_09070 [Alphaproteobacteria bacterium]|nr:hypothetical protein [Alphaproteobacteria bacterium]
MSNWQKLLEPEIVDYIKNHEESDLAKLAFSGAPNPDWPFPLILEQIKLRRKAKIKLPEFHDVEGYIFISQDLLEQASSQACALYKASLLGGGTFCDLTAGHGIDSYYIAQHFKKSSFIERDSDAAEILQHNFDILVKHGKLNCDVTVQSAFAEDVLENLELVDCLYLDPQRRADSKKGIFDLSMTSPNVLSLLPLIQKKCKKFLLKTSPFLDIPKSINDLKYVSQVHIIQYQGDCKEVLYLLDFETDTASDQVDIVAVDIDNLGNIKKSFRYTLAEERDSFSEFSMPLQYIYEAGPAFMKAGGYKLLAERFNLKKLHSQTHLYTSDDVCQEFPGKFYKVEDIRPVQSKALTIRKADLAIRNFPESVEILRKKLKIKDGGQHRIYACTVMDNTKKLVICTKD